MDLITRRFGPKASTIISIIMTFMNLFVCLIFWFASIIPTSTDYSGFNTIFGGTWFILLGSTVAFLISAVCNNFLNYSIGKLFKKNPQGKMAFYTRTYISTFVGQFIDNLVFATIVFMFFAPMFWDGFSWSFIQCIFCSLTGAVAELLLEIIFSPIGYKICKKWEEEKIGLEYMKFKENK